jgi:dihydrofolate reductase
VTFDIVVAADLAWGIGKASALPWPKLRGDLAHFKRVTTDAPAGRQNAIIMGRNTWLSREVSARPLPRRINVLVTRSTIAVPGGMIIAGSFDEALARGAAAAAGVFVVGGAQLYREALAHEALRYVYLTRVDGRFDCDTMIPDLDALGFTRAAWDGELDAEDGGVRYRIERLTPPPRT